MGIHDEKPGMPPFATEPNHAPTKASEFVVVSRLPPSPLRCYGGRDFSPTIAFSGGGCLEELSNRLNPATPAFFVLSCKRPVGDLTRLNQIKVKPNETQRACFENIYCELYTLDQKLHDAFGIPGQKGGLHSVMKNLLEIRHRARN